MGLCFTADVFFIYFFRHKISNLPWPISDLKLGEFYNASTDFGGPSPEKNFGPKNM